MNVSDEAQKLRGRFQALQKTRPELRGVDGVEALLEHLLSMPCESGRLKTVVDGLRELAEILDPGPLGAAPQKSAVTPGLEQFVATFQKEAEKRLRGLSISLMGVFGEAGSEEAIDQTAGHLHSIRGGAAMLGLDDVATLAGTMEDVVKQKRRVPAEARDWPTRTILRGFAILHEAITSESVAIDAPDAAEVLASLKATLPKAAREPLAPEPSRSEVLEVSHETESASHETAPDSHETSGAAKSLEQPILIVDDIETIAASVGFILSDLDCPIEIASNGEEAFQMLQSRPFSLVVSDVDMPRMDGIALTRRIREDEALGALPVILLTSLDHPEERQAGLDAGATDYLIKGSIGGGDLLARVRDLLEEAPFVARETPQTKRRILVAEDTETVAASIAFVLSERPYDIVLATDGKDALRKLEKDSFDLLITDMQMPYVSGVELVAHVRADERHQAMPIIMLTSVQEEALIKEATDAGVDRYLIKGEIAGGKLLTVADELFESV